jgi:HAD superfamily hydrolase (TIGR01549 family)
MHKPLGIIFDFGDTILHLVSVDWAAGPSKLLQLTNDTKGLSAGDIQLVMDELGHELFPLRDNSTLELRYDSYLRILCETLGITLIIGYTEAAREIWHASMKYLPTEGIQGVLETIGTMGVKMGILSNSTFSETVLREELVKHGIERWFSIIMSSADYGLMKPHHRLIELAVKRMELSREDVWFVGDKLDYDIKGALNFGLLPVWYNPTDIPIRGDYQCLEIKHWRELQDKVKSLYG